MTGASASGVRVVCFDLGGVLVRICRSWEEGCAAAGVPAHEGWRAGVEAIGRSELVHRFERGGITGDEFFAQVASMRAGMYTPEEVRRVHAAWLLGEYPGVARVVERLSELAHVETACLSNTNHEHWAAMEAGAYPALERLRHRHASHLLGHRKPDEACFRAFERAVGRAGGAILLFDDLEANVAAAAACGWRVERVDHAGDTAAQIDDALRRHGVW